MSEFQPGEIVNITIKGARIEEPTDEVGNLEYTYPAGLSRFEGVVVPLAESVTVERVAPAGWPPQPGDLWKDRDGTLWFAVEDKGHQQVGLMCDSSQVWNPNEVGANWSPLTLVHREGGESS